VQLALDALDRLVDTLEERGPLSAVEAARSLFATSSISTGDLDRRVLRGDDARQRQARGRGEVLLRGD